MAVLEAAPAKQTDRSMSVSELREAARRARSATGSGALAAAYEVEIQKKFALAASSVFLALAAAAIAMRFPRGGVRLVIGTSCFVFPAYWASLVGGERLAEGQVISPFVAMWIANAFLLAVVPVLAWRPSPPGSTLGPETVAIDS
jgi:lipopolysaccharide export LptBFGC system permease protein LptF